MNDSKLECVQILEDFKSSACYKQAFAVLTERTDMSDRLKNALIDNIFLKGCAMTSAHFKQIVNSNLKDNE